MIITGYIFTTTPLGGASCPLLSFEEGGNPTAVCIMHNAIKQLNASPNGFWIILTVTENCSHSRVPILSMFCSKLHDSCEKFHFAFCNPNF